MKLLAFDLDGTTLTGHQHLSARNRKALERAGQMGILLVPASGRMRTFLPEEITSLPGVRWAITSNGAGVYDLKSGECIWDCLIPNAKALEVQQLLKSYDVYVEYYREGRAITLQGAPEKAKTYFGFPKTKWHFLTKDFIYTEDFEVLLRETGLCPEKINLPYLPTPELREELWNKLLALGGLRLTSSIPDNLEINASGAHKGAGLKALCRHLKISISQVMAIGDNGNDVTMLQCAGVSVAVADALPEALAAAKYRTSAHDEDGLAEAVERFLIQQE